MAWTKAKLQQILADLDASKRYYALFEKRRAIDSEGIDPKAALEEMTQLGFTYKKSDKFFRMAEQSGNKSIELHVALSPGIVELILNLKADGQVAGGPLTVIAREIARESDPSFKYSPPSPLIPYATREDLREAVKFGIDLYSKTKDRLFIE